MRFSNEKWAQGSSLRAGTSRHPRDRWRACAFTSALFVSRRRGAILGVEPAPRAGMALEGGASDRRSLQPRDHEGVPQGHQLARPHHAAVRRDPPVMETLLAAPHERDEALDAGDRAPEKQDRREVGRASAAALTHPEPLEDRREVRRHPERVSAVEVNGLLLDEVADHPDVMSDRLLDRSP
jgi:hypothetical protein